MIRYLRLFTELRFFYFSLYFNFYVLFWSWKIRLLSFLAIAFSFMRWGRHPWSLWFLWLALIIWRSLWLTAQAHKFLFFIFNQFIEFALLFKFILFLVKFFNPFIYFYLCFLFLHLILLKICRCWINIINNLLFLWTFILAKNIWFILNVVLIINFCVFLLFVTFIIFVFKSWCLWWFWHFCFFYV